MEKDYLGVVADILANGDKSQVEEYNYNTLEFYNKQLKDFSREDCKKVCVYLTDCGWNIFREGMVFGDDLVWFCRNKDQVASAIKGFIKNIERLCEVMSIPPKKFIINLIVTESEVKDVYRVVYLHILEGKKNTLAWNNSGNNSGDSKSEISLGLVYRELPSDRYVLNKKPSYLSKKESIVKSTLIDFLKKTKENDKDIKEVAIAYSKYLKSFLDSKGMVEEYGLIGSKLLRYVVEEIIYEDSSVNPFSEMDNGDKYQEIVDNWILCRYPYLRGIVNDIIEILYDSKDRVGLADILWNSDFPMFTSVRWYIGDDKQYLKDIKSLKNSEDLVYLNGKDPEVAEDMKISKPKGAKKLDEDLLEELEYSLSNIVGIAENLESSYGEKLQGFTRILIEEENGRVKYKLVNPIAKKVHTILDLPKEDIYKCSRPVSDFEMMFIESILGLSKVVPFEVKRVLMPISEDVQGYFCESKKEKGSFDLVFIE